MMRYERGKETTVFDSMELILEGRRTNPAMKMIEPPTNNPEAVRLEIKAKAVHYGLSEPHSEAFSHAWMRNPSDCLGVLPEDVALKFDTALKHQQPTPVPAQPRLDTILQQAW